MIDIIHEYTYLDIDRDERIVEGECNCNWYQQNKLYQGPCKHILALRMQQARQSRWRKLHGFTEVSSTGLTQVPYI